MYAVHVVFVHIGLVYVTYYLDNNVTNPYQLWESMGSPDYPSAEQFRQLRTKEVFLSNKLHIMCSDNISFLY